MVEKQIRFNYDFEDKDVKRMRKSAKKIHEDRKPDAELISNTQAMKKVKDQFAFRNADGGVTGTTPRQVTLVARKPKNHQAADEETLPNGVVIESRFRFRKWRSDSERDGLGSDAPPSEDPLYKAAGRRSTPNSESEKTDVASLPH